MPTEQERQSMTHQAPAAPPPQSMLDNWMQGLAQHSSLGSIANQIQQLSQMTPQQLEQEPAYQVAQGFAGTTTGKPIRAYHSSPHDFESFDLSKIGTGEGAQVYGHGLYFAENPSVSGQGGQYWQNFMRRFSGPERDAATRLQRLGFDRDAAIEALKANIANARTLSGSAGFSPYETRQHIKNLENQLYLLESGKPVGPRTYEVELQADPNKMLDWDKPIKEQPVDVKAGLEQVFPAINRPPPNWVDWSRQGLRPNSVRDAIDSLNAAVGPQRAAEEFKAAGIPGVKYLDQGSRSIPGKIAGLRKMLDDPNMTWQRTQIAHELADLEAEQLTRNYAVWQPEIIKLLKKYGILLPGAGGLGGVAERAMQDQQQQQ